MLNPLEEKILSYLIEHKDEGEFIGVSFPDEKFSDVHDAIKGLAAKGYVKPALTLISASARLTPDGKYYFEIKNKQRMNAMGRYYQLLIATDKEKIVKADVLDISEIIETIVIPYLQEKEFYVDGYVLSKKLVKRIKIGVTEKPAQKIADYKNQTMPAGIIMVITTRDIIENSEYTTDITAKVMSNAKDIIKERNMKTIESNKMDNTKIFIVHGRDNELKQEVARFIEHLHITPIILHEQASKGMTIIEKIEEYSNVGFGVVLYTPCDVGYKKGCEDDKKGRARQNVVFEHGYLIGKLGRKRVCALIKQDVEKPNDISGVVYIPYEGAWKIDLAKEMKAAGYKIDMNDVID